VSVHDDLEGYVLGGLAADDVRVFEAHLRDCADCRDGIASYGVVLRALANVPMTTAPIARTLRHASEARRRALFGAGALAAAAAVGIAIGRLAFAGTPSDLEAIAVMTADPARGVALRGPVANGSALVGRDHEHTAFVVRGLPAPPPGRGYQVWVRGRVVRSPGMLHRMRDGLEILVVPGDVIADARTIGVTMEPSNGSPVRTGAPQLSGDAS
jgi:anti-sigma-K factor RskA